MQCIYEIKIIFFVLQNFTSFVIKLKRNFPAEIAITDFHYFREASIKELPANVGWAKNPRPFQTLLFDNGAAIYCHFQRISGSQIPIFFLQLLLRDFLKGKGRKDSANTFLFFFNEEFLSIQIKSKKGRKRRSS